MKIRKVLLVLGILFVLAEGHVFGQTTFDATASKDYWNNVWISGWINSPPPAITLPNLFLPNNSGFRSGIAALGNAATQRNVDALLMLQQIQAAQQIQQSQAEHKVVELMLEQIQTSKEVEQKQFEEVYKRALDAIVLGSISSAQLESKKEYPEWLLERMSGKTKEQRDREAEVDTKEQQFKELEKLLESAPPEQRPRITMDFLQKRNPAAYLDRVDKVIDLHTKQSKINPEAANQTLKAMTGLEIKALDPSQPELVSFKTKELTSKVHEKNPLDSACVDSLAESKYFQGLTTDKQAHILKIVCQEN